jgi:hypothetical protein
MLAFLRVIFIKDHGREPVTGEALPSHPLKGVPSFADAFARPIAMMGSMGFDPVLISAIREGVWIPVIENFVRRNPVTREELLDFVSGLQEADNLDGARKQTKIRDCPQRRG